MKSQETKAIVLDFLIHGKQNDQRRIPLVQMLGKEQLLLLEAIPKKESFLKPLEEVYIGTGEREKIHHIKGRISYDELTQTSKNDLDEAVGVIVDENEDKFIKFYNISTSISLRMHQIELLPGIGKKHTLKILAERRIKPFESFKDLRNRIDLMPEPRNAIIQRIIQELSEEDKYYLFTQLPKKKEFEKRRRY